MRSPNVWVLTAAAAAVIVVGTVAIAERHHESNGGGQAEAAPAASTSSAHPSPSPSPTWTADPADVADGSIPTLIADPMDDMGQDVAGLAPATTSAESDAQAIAVAELYFDTLVDTSLVNVDWRHILEPLTTPEQYKTGVHRIDATWYDGLGTRTAPATIERSGSAGRLYVHIVTTNDDDIALVLVRPTEADTWRVDGFRG